MSDKCIWAQFKNKGNISYPNLPSAIQLVLHDANLPMLHPRSDIENATDLDIQSNEGVQKDNNDSYTQKD